MAQTVRRLTPRSLKAITGKRPHRQCCDRPLKPRTDFLEVQGHLEAAPEQDALLEMNTSESWQDGKNAILRGYRSDRVFRLDHSTTYKGAAVTKISFWRGTYDGYGTGQDGTSLFCSYPCGLAVGVACWNAGMRLRRDG